MLLVRFSGNDGFVRGVLATVLRDTDRVCGGVISILGHTGDLWML